MVITNIEHFRTGSADHPEFPREFESVVARCSSLASDFETKSKINQYWPSRIEIFAITCYGHFCQRNESRCVLDS